MDFGGISRLRSKTLRMDDRGVDCGEIGGNSDWKIVVVRDSRCFGMAGFEALEFSFSVVGVGVVKLFMTRSGAVRYDFLPPLGCFIALRTSLQREYFSTRKCSVGPRGVRARRRLVLPVEEREKRRRWETPRGPAIVV